MQRALALAIVVLLAQVAHARALPALTGHVNDTAAALTPSQRQSLEATLSAYEQQTGHQWALIILDTLEGEPIENFGIRLADAWKLGQKKSDNGLLLIIAINDRKMRIEVGYGLEAVITDALSSHLIRRVLAPAFRDKRYYDGIVTTFGTLIRAAGGEAIEIPKHTSKPQHGRGGGLGIIALFILFMLIPSRWRLPLLMMFLSSNRDRGGWSSRGGGGYSGGGGGFGGGGSSGGW
jgi:uncharacterized protein